MAFRLADSCRRCRQAALPLAVGALYQGPTFRPFDQGMSRFVTSCFQPYLRRFAVTASLLLIAAAYAVRRRWRSRSAGGQRIVAEQQADHRRADSRRPTSSKSRSRPRPRTTPSSSTSGCSSRRSGASSCSSGLAFRPRLAEINAQARAARAGAGRRPAARARDRRDRTAGADRRKGRDQRRARRRRKPVGPHQRPDRPDRRACAASCSRSLLTKRYDINYALAGEVADAFHAEGDRSSAGRSASWLRFVVQFKLQLAALPPPSSRCSRRRSC